MIIQNVCNALEDILIQKNIEISTENSKFSFQPTLLETLIDPWKYGAHQGSIWHAMAYNCIKLAYSNSENRKKCNLGWMQLLELQANHISQQDIEHEIQTSLTCLNTVSRQSFLKHFKEMLASTVISIHMDY